MGFEPGTSDLDSDAIPLTYINALNNEKKYNALINRTFLAKNPFFPSDWYSACQISNLRVKDSNPVGKESKATLVVNF